MGAKSQNTRTKVVEGVSDGSGTGLYYVVGENYREFPGVSQRGKKPQKGT